MLENRQAIQLSGRDLKGQSTLSVVARRTYTLNESGRCTLAEVQAPLSEDCSFYPDNPRLFCNDVDLLTNKTLTDIVIKGHACNSGKSSRFLAGFQIGKFTNNILVVGNRKPYLQNGRIKFGEPDLVDKVPLRYDFAYGGKDSIGEQKIGLPPSEMIKSLPSDIDVLEGNLYRYMRNPLGKGYLVELNNQSLELTELPNLEDPADLLTPENLVVGKLENWVHMPLPRCTDWVHPAWFPRVAYFGFYRMEDYIKTLRLKEIEKGFLQMNVLTAKQGQLNLLCNNGASLGFQLPYLRLGEMCKLTNVHPLKKEFEFQIPKESPEIFVDGRNGTLKKTMPVIQTVIIEPEKNLLSIVWRGTAPAVRPYFDQELQTMPFKVNWRN